MLTPLPYYHRHLPHWHPDESWLFITWRLAGSLPKFLRTGVTEPPGKAFRSIDQTLDRTEIGPLWLNDARIAKMLCEVIQQSESPMKLCIIGSYVIMSNHVHLLAQPLQTPARLTQWIKGVSARRANQFLKRKDQPFCQHESYDRWVRSQSEYHQIRSYIEWNPVKAGLVSASEEWPWSSAGQMEKRTS